MDINTIQYKYSIELEYLKTDKNKTVKIFQECIKTLIIDRSYDVNNMPIIMLNISLDKNLLDDMIINSQKNLMILSIYKYNSTDKMAKSLYVKDRFVYFLEDDLNDNEEIDYAKSEMDRRDDVLKNVNIGLMQLKAINDNKKTYNTILHNTNMVNAIYFCTKHMGNVLIEPLDYNTELGQVIIPPRDSVTEILKYLNNLAVFYKSSYRYFIDFDTTYIISSKGAPIARKNDNITSVNITTTKMLDQLGNLPGMKSNKNQKTYEIYVNVLDTSAAPNRVTEKSYNSINAVSTSGKIGENKLDVNNSDYSTGKTKSVRVMNDNTNLLKNLQSDAENSALLFSMNKNDLDCSIFTINKEYTIKNLEPQSKYNGKYLLTRKVEMFIREDKEFLLNTMLNFRKIKS